MALSIVLVAITVAFVGLTSLIGRAKITVTSGIDNQTTERDSPKTVDALSDIHAINELLQLKREALEATNVSSQRMANLIRDVENAIEKTESTVAVTRDGHGAQGGSAWS